MMADAGADTAVIEALILTRYMRGLLLTRNLYLKQVAEADTV
jgi:hypothetical protein